MTTNIDYFSFYELKIIICRINVDVIKKTPKTKMILILRESFVWHYEFSNVQKLYYHLSLFNFVTCDCNFLLASLFSLMSVPAECISIFDFFSCFLYIYQK